MKVQMLAVATIAAATLVGAGGAQAAGEPQSKVRCFTGATSTCTPVGNNGAVLDVQAGPEGYAGLYINGKRQNGKTLGRVDFAFDYAGATSGGSPRFSIPVDEDADGDTESYAFVDALNCGNTGRVSSWDANCVVYYGNLSYPNWDAFALANPTWTISSDIPFAIADQPGQVTLSNVSFAVS